MAYSFVTKFLPATSTKGARISISHGRGRKLVVPFPHGKEDPHGTVVRDYMLPYEKSPTKLDCPYMVGTYVRSPSPDGSGDVFVLVKEGDKFEII